MSDISGATRYEQEAYDLGREHALNAASWVIDGNTPQEHIARMVAWLDDGDPRADDYLPRRPDLSGEHADDLTPAKLAEEVGLDPDGFGTDDDQSIEIDAVCDAYESGVNDHFGPECERILRAALTDD